MIDDYTMGKIAAHAYVDELQRLNLGYEVAVEKTAAYLKEAGGYGQAPPGMDPAAWAEKMKNFKAGQAQKAIGTGVNSLKKAIGQ
jgi:hypothetical protein